MDHAERQHWSLPANRSFVLPNLIAAPPAAAPPPPPPPQVNDDGESGNDDDADGNNHDHHHNDDDDDDGHDGDDSHPACPPSSSSAGAAVASVSRVVATELVFLGRLEPRKGLNLMVDAVEQLARNAVGDQPLRNLTVSFMGRSVVDPALGDTAAWIRAQHQRTGWGGAEVGRYVLSSYGHCLCITMRVRAQQKSEMGWGRDEREREIGEIVVVVARWARWSLEEHEEED
jgi:hypothetical protein